MNNPGTEITVPKQTPEHLFQPGQSGNLAGRPRGSRHKATMAALALLEGEAHALTRRAIDAALAGNMVALKLCLERLLPPAKDRPIFLDFPEVKNLSDLAMLNKVAIDGIISGDVTSSQAVVLAKIIEIHHRVIATAEIEARLARIEEAMHEK